MTQVVVVIGGGELSPTSLDAVQRDAVVIAADSGLDHAVAAGLRPAHLVGDLDSISASGRMWAYAHGTTVDEHPARKDLTDTELALQAAAAVADGTTLLLLGGLAGTDDRLDHLLGTLLALGAPELARFSSVRAIVGATEVHVVHPGCTARPDLDAGRLFSVLALHGPCTGVQVRGAEWELVDATLTSTEARGVSNLVKEDLMISVAAGVLTVVVP